MEENKLARKLSSRHVQMIALGGAIGDRIVFGFRKCNSSSRSDFVSFVFSSWNLLFLYDAGNR